MSNLKDFIDIAGGVPAVAKACGISDRAVYKWLATCSLPRTEYTGETNYAEAITTLASQRGGEVDAATLRASAAPGRTAA